ncbi:HesA/MoeB/ThiF family protein [Desulfobacter curvatus]|uniref:HesA/MoeB/ThiF family protein n=1 Tax=Desulfobacter curvatus TaxID=2290 RepID=UPI00037E74E6|nr:ThiF family adenylyltransferase [Desulfobacter curvatus]
MGDFNWSKQYQTFIGRNDGIITPEQQEKLRKSTACVFGMGGIGSPAFEVLVRAGIGKFKIIDNDVYDASNMNRQIFANIDTIGKKKVLVAKEFAKKINPEIKIECYERIEEENINKIISEADVILLAIDELKPCVIISRAARKMKIPVVEGWALPFGNVRTFTQDTPQLEEAYGLQTLGKEISNFSDEELRRMGTELLFGLGKIEGIADFYSDEVIEGVARGIIPSFAPMAWLTSVLMANEALKILLNIGCIAKGPDFTMYDPYMHRIPSIGR